MAYNLRALLTADVRGFLGGVDSASDSLDDLAQTGNQANRDLETGARSSGAAYDLLKGAILGAVAAFSASVIAGGVAEIIRANAEINNLSASLNVSRTALQTWGVLAKQTGVDVVAAFQDMTERVGEFAAEGTGEAAFVFKRLNLDVNEFIGLQGDQQILKVVDAMDQLSDISQAERISIMERLISDGSRLLPFLEDNADQLREIQRIAAESGALISDEQNEVLTEAANNLTNIELALEGVQNVAGVMGAELINAVAGPIVEHLLTLDDLLEIIKVDVGVMSDAWSFAMERAGDSSDALLAREKSNISAWSEYFRVGVSYFPVYASAAYDAVAGYADSYIQSDIARWNTIKSAAATTFASVVDFASIGFGKVGDIVGVVVSFAINRMADLVSGASAAVGKLDFLPGFESAYAGLEGVESRLRAQAVAAGKTGDSYRSMGKAVADSLRESSVASAQTAREAELQSRLSENLAKSAIATAKAYSATSEEQRGLNIEMNKAERQFTALNQATETGTSSARKYYVNQQAVNKALADNTEGAKKASEATKKKTTAERDAEKASKAAQRAADKAAKAQARQLAQAGRDREKATKALQRDAEKAAKAQARQLAQVEKERERALKSAARDAEKARKEQERAGKKQAAKQAKEEAKAQREVAKALAEKAKVLAQLKKAQDDELDGLNDTYAKLTLTEQAYYAASVAAKQLGDAVTKEAEALKYRNTLAQEKDALQQRSNSLKNPTEQLKGRLEQRGLNAGDVGGLVDESLKIRMAELAQQTELVRKEAELTKDEFRLWELVNKEGLTPALAETQVALEKQAEQLVQSKQLSGEFAAIIEGDVLGSLQGLVDTGNGLLDSLINKLLETIITGQGLGGMFDGLGGGSGGGLFDGLVSGIGGLLGFQNGGSFNVGGSGGTDSQVVAFRASPNERVSIQTPEQQAASGGGVVINAPFAPVIQGGSANDRAAIRQEMVELFREYDSHFPNKVSQALGKGGLIARQTGMAR